MRSLFLSAALGLGALGLLLVSAPSSQAGQPYCYGDAGPNFSFSTPRFSINFGQSNYSPYYGNGYNPRSYGGYNGGYAPSYGGYNGGYVPSYGRSYAPSYYAPRSYDPGFYGSRYYDYCR